MSIKTASEAFLQVFRSDSRIEVDSLEMSFHNTMYVTYETDHAMPVADQNARQPAGSALHCRSAGRMEACGGREIVPGTPPRRTANKQPRLETHKPNICLVGIIAPKGFLRHRAGSYTYQLCDGRCGIRETDGKMMQIRWIVIRVFDSVEPESRLATQASVLEICFAGMRASSLGGTDGEICDEWCVAERESSDLQGPDRELCDLF